MNRTPKTLTPAVLGLCRTLRPNSKPVFLPITPEPSCEPLSCFENVRQKVERDGGKLVLGWSIWEWPKVLVEAEHHAVYQYESGEYRDITPAAPDAAETTRLFLRDDTATYDFDYPGFRRDNIRHALSNRQDVRQFIKIEKAIAELLNSVHGVGRIELTGAKAMQMNALLKEKMRVSQSIVMATIGRNDPCPCGSGRRFKHCHGT